MKKSALAIATILGLTSTSASAFDYFFQTGRSMGYGSAGTTYAHWSSAANYNPALIGAAAGTDEDFFLVLNTSLRLNEQNDAIDTMDEFSEETDSFDNFSNVDLLEGDKEALQNNIDSANQLVTSVEKLDGAGMNLGLGINGGLGMSFETFAMSFQVNTQIVVGGTVNVAEDDTSTFRRFSDLGQLLLDDVRPAYDEIKTAEDELEEIQQRFDNGTATQADLDEAERLVAEAEVEADNLKSELVGINTEYSDIFDTEDQTIIFNDEDLKSNTRFAAIGWVEAGMTVGSNWALESGKVLSVGATFKAVHLAFYDYQASTAGFDEDNLDGDAYKSEEDFVTADIGAVLALDTEDKWRVGVSVKNLNGATITTNPAGLQDGQEELTFEVKPQVRIGTSYNGGWYRLAADVDVTESKGPHYADGTEFFKGTQYASVGAIVNAWDFAELRIGYRHNLIENDDLETRTSEADGLVTAGVGIYLGPIQFDLGVQASEDEVGAGLQAMITW